MKLHYRALNTDQHQLSGEIEAVGIREASRALRAQGLTPLEVKPQGQSAQPRARHHKPRKTEIRLSLQQLIILLESGVALDEAVNSLSASSQNPAIGTIFQKMSSSLRRGESFSQALEDSGLAAPNYFFQLAQAGELTGKLASSLRTGLQQMTREEELANEFRTALLYPCFLVFSGVSAVLIIFTLVIPRFSNLLDRSENLPAISWAVLAFGRFLDQNLVVLISALLIASLLLAYTLRRPAVRQTLWDQIARMPMVGLWIQESDIARWSGILATLLDNSVSLLKAIELADQGIGVRWLRKRFSTVSRNIRNGKNMTEALQETRFFSRIGLDLVRVGERSGELPQMLRALSELYVDQGRNRVKRFLVLLEPIAILLIAGVIGVIMTGIVMAIMSMSDMAL